MTELERYKEALESIHYESVKTTTSDVQLRAFAELASRQALNPPQEFEEVEVGVYWCVGCRELVEDCHCTLDKHHHIKLTGTYRRPVKQKVKRREEIAWCSTYTRKYSRHENSGNLPIPEGARMFIEWEE